MEWNIFILVKFKNSSYQTTFVIDLIVLAILGDSHFQSDVGWVSSLITSIGSTSPVNIILKIAIKQNGWNCQVNNQNWFWYFFFFLTYIIKPNEFCDESLY